MKEKICQRFIYSLVYINGWAALKENVQQVRKSGARKEREDLHRTHFPAISLHPHIPSSKLAHQSE
jgi:hypothetical protein